LEQGAIERHDDRPALGFQRRGDGQGGDSTHFDVVFATTQGCRGDCPTECDEEKRLHRIEYRPAPASRERKKEIAGGPDGSAGD
jgi:hypothetical protein